MEPRKVQITGKSTFVVSLPKKWVNRVNIRTGDSVGIVPLPDNCLLIDPRFEERDKFQYTLVIEAEEKTPEMILRQFIGAYLAGFTSIEIKNHEGLSKKEVRVIKNIPMKVMGPFIVDETRNSIVLNDLLDSNDFLMLKGIKRMNLLATSMQSVAMERLRGKIGGEHVDMDSRDDEVDKLALMISRQFNRMQMDITMSEKMEMTMQDALCYLLISRAIERIADHAVKISKNADSLSIDEEMMHELYRTGIDVIGLFDMAMECVYDKKFDKAYESMLKIKSEETTIEKLREGLNDIRPCNNSGLVSAALIVESLDRIRCYSEDITEIAMDRHFVDKYNEMIASRVARGNKFIFDETG